MSRDKVQTALLFAILFVFIGWSAPLFYVTHAPTSNFVEIHDFTAENTSVGQDEHNVCFNRTVHKPAPVNILIEMKIIQEGDRIIEEDSFVIDAYFQEGQQSIIIPREIQAVSLEPGKYIYTHTVQMEYANGRVTRTIEFDSEPFFVFENESQLDPKPLMC